MQPLTALNCNCRCLADGCSEAFVTNASMKNHMARVHHHQEKRYQVQSFSYFFFLHCFVMTMLTFTGLLLLHLPSSFFSATTRAVERTSTRRTNLKPINMTTKSFCLFSKQLQIWYKSKWNFVSLAISNFNFLSFCIVVLSVAVQRNFPPMGNWSIMRKYMKVSNLLLFMLILVFNLKTHVCLSATGYPCEITTCSFQGKTWTEYLKHRKEHKGMFVVQGRASHCVPCYSNMQHMYTNSRHWVTLTSVSAVKLPCGECKKQFNNTWFLHQHELRVHSGEKRMLSCPREGCDKKFTRHFNLESHVLGDHEGKKPFSCAYADCGKNFAMKVNLYFQLINMR